MNSKTRNRLILWAAITFGACSPALYMPSMSDASRTGVSTDSLMIGRTLYINHCGSCHNLYLPEHFSQKHWLQEMPEMQNKAKITNNETLLISKFVLARSKQE
ncbi:MAG: hypothetical protein Q8N05_22865 [Bacteroidota bacterium]|nr:hypothetical protein [Bacteroidota bacterium]